ncbi:hypothetical protein HK096_006938, partial [Nowakowskiella sp. JEL0078]
MPSGKFKSVLLAMSGGVDSSVSALLLKNMSFSVNAVYMLNWDLQDESSRSCSSDKDWLDVQKINLTKEYWSYVFEPSLASYENGLTPNPDVDCNKYIKFGSFWDKIMSSTNPPDFIATGHYARKVLAEDGSPILMRALDRSKDQSYFLSKINPRVLEKVLFPVGELLKSEVKVIAQSEGFPNAQKKESVGICFIGKRDFGSFLSDYVAQTPGEFISIVDGAKIGTHKGIGMYTLGQRARISGGSRKWFVAEKDVKKNIVYVAPTGDHPSLFRKKIWLSDWTFLLKKLDFTSLKAGLEVLLQYRYRMKEVTGTISLDSNNQILVEFFEPQEGLALGQ